MQFYLAPYYSVGPLRFSMTKDDVSSILGKPDSIFKNGRNEFVFTFNSIGVEAVFSLQSELLVEVSFRDKGNLVVAGINIFNCKNALNHLLAQDANPLEYVGILFLPKLGLTLSGFHNEDDRVITALCKGRIDHLLPKFAKFCMQ